MSAKLDGLAQQVAEIRRDLVQLDSRFELMNAAVRQERNHENEKLRGELGRRMDELATDVKELSGYRWKLVGFFLAGGVGWTAVTGVLTLYFATR